MVVRRLLVAAMSVAVAFVSTGSSPGASNTGPGATVYQLRNDMRMCPSPACGGFWASRVNFRLTTCLDSTGLAACYAASVDLSALAPAVRPRARLALTAGRALVEGAFGRYPSSAGPQLAKLVAARVWIAAGSHDGADTVYRVVDTGLRCIRAPCFSLRATVVNGTRSLMLSGLDLAGSGASPGDINRARAALAHGGVLASGTMRVVTKPGVAGPARTLAATRVWLSV